MVRQVGSAEKAQPRCVRCAKIVICVGMVEAVVFTVLKIALGLASGSQALVAASLYSIQDFFSSLVAGIGLKVSARPPDRDHPYGHGKVEYLVVVTMSLLVLLGIVALVITTLSSFLGDAESGEPPTMLALWVALVCGVSCWILSKYEDCAGRQLNSPALKSCATHMHGDYLASIAVVVSVIGAKLGYPALDQIVAVIEAVHVVYISGMMLASAISGLMDTSAEPHVIVELKRVVGEIESVIRVRQTTARWSGQTLFAQIDVEVPGHMKVPEVDRLRVGIQQAIRTQVCEHSEALVRVLPASATFGSSRLGAPLVSGVSVE